MYDIGLLSKKSLFQLFAERVIRIQKNAKKFGHLAHDPIIHLFVMTSRMNHETTKQFFEDHEFFGLNSDQVHFFPQGTLPCLTKTGKIMLETPHSIARASDGNGGNCEICQTENLFFFRCIHGHDQAQGFGHHECCENKALARVLSG